MSKNPFKSISEDINTVDYKVERESARRYAKEHLDDSSKSLSDFLMVLIQKSKHVDIKKDLTGIKETARSVTDKGVQATKDNLPEIKKSMVVVLSFLEKHLSKKDNKLESQIQLGDKREKFNGDILKQIISEVDSDNFGKIAVKITNTGIKAVTIVLLDKVGVKKKYTMAIVNSKSINSLTEKVSEKVVNKVGNKIKKGGNQGGKQ